LFVISLDGHEMVNLRHVSLVEIEALEEPGRDLMFLVVAWVNGKKVVLRAFSERTEAIDYLFSLWEEVKGSAV